eukprot:gene2994-4251_t
MSLSGGSGQDSKNSRMNQKIHLGSRNIPKRNITTLEVCHARPGLADPAPLCRRVRAAQHCAHGECWCHPVRGQRVGGYGLAARGRGHVPSQGAGAQPGGDDGGPSSALGPRYCNPRAGRTNYPGGLGAAERREGAQALQPCAMACCVGCPTLAMA